MLGESRAKFRHGRRDFAFGFSLDLPHQLVWKRIRRGAARGFIQRLVDRRIEGELGRPATEDVLKLPYRGLRHRICSSWAAGGFSRGGGAKASGKDLRQGEEA